MSRETKQDRIVRALTDQMTEHLHELKKVDSNPTTKELAIERWAQSFLRNCLGFTASAGYSINPQEVKGKIRPDLIVLHDDQPIFVVEVKKAGFDLNKSDFRSGKIQLKEYLNQMDEVRWGILTNGCEWKLYDFSSPEYGGIEVASFNIKSEDEIDLSKKGIEEQTYECIEFHESSFSGEAWAELSREALAFSPESLAKAILSVDVVKYIAKYVRGEQEYKANHDILTDRLYWLLENGLNDAIKGWNEAKAAEIHKFVNSQKRAARRTKRPKKSSDPVPAKIEIEITATAVPVQVPVVDETEDRAS